jgi:hypothetical protein
MFTPKPESGQKVTKLGEGDAKTHRATGNLCFSEPRLECEQDGPIDYRRGPDHQGQHHL